MNNRNFGAILIILANFIIAPLTLFLFFVFLVGPGCMFPSDFMKFFCHPFIGLFAFILTITLGFLAVVLGVIILIKFLIAIYKKEQIDLLSAEGMMYSMIYGGLSVLFMIALFIKEGIFRL